MSELHIKFGDLLKLEREHQGISLADASDGLKIAEETLVSIEAGDVAGLPSELYFKMFSRSYAEHLGIDYTRTIEAICEELGISLEQDTSKETPARAKRKPEKPSEAETENTESDKASRGNVRRLVILASVIVGGFIIFLLVFQLFITDGANDAANDETITTEADTEPEAAQKVSAAEGYNWDVPTYKSPDSIALTLVARQESWATVLRDGDTVLYQTLAPDRQYTLNAKYRFLVSVGVPRVVDIMIDGQPVFLARTASGRISRVEIDQTNRDRFRQPPKAPTPAPPTPANSVEAASDEVDSALQEGSDTI